MDVESHVREIADTLAIHELRYRYCHLVDAQRYRDWADLFATDGTFTSEIPGRNVYRGPEEIYEFAREVLDNRDAREGGYEYSTHIAVNPLVDVDSEADEGQGHWYFYLTYALEDGTTGWKLGEYDETYRREDGAWKFGSVRVSFNAGESFERFG